jgi:hypothetical protein
VANRRYASLEEVPGTKSVNTIPVIDGIKHRGGFNEIADGSDPMFKAIEKFTNLLPDESTMASDESTGATDSVNQVGELDSMSEVTTKDSSSSASRGYKSPGT